MFIEIKMIKFLSSTQRGSGEKPSHSLHTLWHTVASPTFGKDDHDDYEHDGNNVNMEKTAKTQNCFFLFFNRGDISGEKLQKCNLALFPLCSRITALIPQSFWGHCKHPYNLGNHVTAKDRLCNTCFDLNCQCYAKFLACVMHPYSILWTCAPSDLRRKYWISDFEINPDSCEQPS